MRINGGARRRGMADRQLCGLWEWGRVGEDVGFEGRLGSRWAVLALLTSFFLTNFKIILIKIYLRVNLFFYLWISYYLLLYFLKPNNTYLFLILFYSPYYSYLYLFYSCNQKQYKLSRDRLFKRENGKAIIYLINIAGSNANELIKKLPERAWAVSTINSWVLGL